ncbi:hypothetical protein C0J52_04405 [Blattella germanica]|nr:hypothetical protein C0J52_04405 [Blattella germanica]
MSPFYLVKFLFYPILFLIKPVLGSDKKLYNLMKVEVRMYHKFVCICMELLLCKDPIGEETTRISMETAGMPMPGYHYITPNHIVKAPIH